MNDTNLDPQWERLPAPGNKLEGLGRASIYRAVEAGLVRFRSVKIRPDAKRGIPYISRRDLRSLIENAQKTATPATA